MCAARRFSCPSFFHPSTNRRMYKLLSNGLIGAPCGVPCPSSRLRVLRCLFPFSSVVLFHQLRPSHEPGRVGSCIVGFGACSAFTHLTACTLAQSPCDSLHQRLQQICCLPLFSDCYPVERTRYPPVLSTFVHPPFYYSPV